MLELNRVGILSYIKDNETHDLLGEKTNFRLLSSGLVNRVASSNKWFGFATRVSDELIDIFSLENKNGEKLGHILEEALGDYDGYRNTLYRYLLHDYLCYCEIPTVIRQRDYSGFKDSYNKSLVTANINVVAEWLGISVDEALVLASSSDSLNSFRIIGAASTPLSDNSFSKTKQSVFDIAILFPFPI